MAKDRAAMIGDDLLSCDTALKAHRALLRAMEQESAQNDEGTTTLLKHIYQHLANKQRAADEAKRFWIRAVMRIVQGETGKQ